MSPEESVAGDRGERVLIAGLGNPGREHKLNRHNVGFMILDRLAAQIGEPFLRRQMEALVTDGVFEQRRVLLAKPQTYVNRSGRSVAPLLRYYRLPLENLLVIVDDLDLPQGALRLRAGGGSGGHNGLRSIEANLDSQEFPRLRIGIGRPPGRMEPADYVLQDFEEDELVLMQEVFSQAMECIALFLSDDIHAAMTACNAATDE
jgi:PTH1 family peptidyl-tRNA hydrolase